MKIFLNKGMLSARTRPLSRSRAFRACFRKPNARNGTRPEPRLRIILFGFQNSSFTCVTKQLENRRKKNASAAELRFLLTTSYGAVSKANDFRDNPLCKLNNLKVFRLLSFPCRRRPARRFDFARRPLQAYRKDCRRFPATRSYSERR